jgi:hypothetical protein
LVVVDFGFRLSFFGRHYRSRLRGERTQPAVSTQYKVAGAISAPEEATPLIEARQEWLTDTCRRPNGRNFLPSARP